MSTHPQFTGIGTEPGVIGYRIVNFQPEKIEIPAAEPLKLFGGDSYIFLQTYRHGNSTRHNIFYWLGEQSTTDEKGAAAVLSVELDDSFGGEPVQYRETQYYESPKFLELFKEHGVTYLEGGAESGFRVVKRDPDLRLFQVKANPLNRDAPVIVSIPLRAELMNHGDAFILQTKETVFIWNGKGSSLKERHGASLFASTLGRKRTQICEGDDEDFFEHIQGEFADVQPADGVEEDQTFIAAQHPTFRTLLTDATEITEDDIFYVDAGNHVYIYRGKSVGPDVLKGAMGRFETLLAEEDPSVRVIFIGKNSAHNDAQWQQVVKNARATDFSKL